MILIEIAKDFVLSRKAGKSSGDRWSAFCALFQLRLKALFLGRNRQEYSQKIFGWKIYGYIYETMLFLFKEIFIFNDYKFTAQVNNPVIIDCGANIGCATLYLKKAYPNATVICFEANPFTYRLLEKNITTNHIQGITIHNLALANENGELSFFTTEHQGSLVGSLIQSRGGNKEVKVTAAKLSDYIKPLTKVDLIKMDVEGAEHEIVKDLASSGSLAKVNELILEYHHNVKGADNSFSSFLKVFEGNGFTYSIRTTFENFGEMQDLLIHFKRK